jgi:hypothetical protein
MMPHSLVDMHQHLEKYKVQQVSFLFPSDRSVQKRKLACRTLYDASMLKI